MKLTFCGAARQVTGSMYLLELENDFTILIDCGQDMEKGKPYAHGAAMVAHPAWQRFPFEPSDIDVVILTHAHIDHTGRLPLLYKEGYEGQVLCTTPTYYLTQILLHDAAVLNQYKLKKALDKKKNSRTLPAEIDHLYFGKQVEDTMRQFVPIAFGQKFRINPMVSVTFNYAGHILGASNVILHIKEGKEEKSICFSGDVGRKNYPLLQDPKPMPQIDYLVCESTYGSRNHSYTETPEQALTRVIAETCVEKKGKLIIPAFSVGRSQAIFYTLNKIYQKGLIPKIKVYADSPMAKESSLVYEKFVSLLNKEAKDFYDDYDELFDFDGFEFVSDLKKSKALSNQYEACIIVSASGMIYGGRVENHVKENLQNSKATICIVGYCAEGTIGHELMNKAKEVTIKNQKLEVRCHVEVLDCFSAHAGQSDLLDFVKQQSPNTLKQLFLTHGELTSMEAFANLLSSEGYNNVVMPQKNESFDL